MYKKIMITGCVFAALSVVLGAIAAHALEKHLTDRMLKVFETAARYQMYHSIAIIICGILYLNHQYKQIKTAFQLFIFGIIFFSGSLYSLSLLSLLHNDSFNIIGAITPIGGICFIFGWIFLALGLSKMK